MPTMVTFLKRMLTVFLARVSPVSRQAKPRCMMKTKAVAMTIHRLLAMLYALASGASAMGASLNCTASLVWASTSSWPSDCVVSKQSMSSEKRPIDR